MGESSIFKLSLILIRFGETLLEWKIEILCHKKNNKINLIQERIKGTEKASHIHTLFHRLLVSSYF